MIYSNHITELIYGIWSIEKEIAEYYLSSFFSQPEQLFTHDYSGERAENRPVLYSINSSNQIIEKEYDPLQPTPQKTVAIIKINGVISRYDKTCGPEGVESYIKRIAKFSEDVNIDAIVLKINSPGGESNAANYMAQQLKYFSEKKPILAFVDDLCCSAAYWIASACMSIGAAGKLSVVGSVGTYTILKNYDRMFQKKGINVHEIYASKSTEKNIEFREALKGNYEKLIADLDFFNEHFLNSVIRNRPSLKTKHDWKTGKKYFAADALKNNLIDFISPFNVFIENILQ